MEAEDVNITMSLTDDEMQADIDAACLAALDGFANRYHVFRHGDISIGFIRSRYNMRTTQQGIDFMDAWVAEHPEYERVKATDRLGSRKWFWALRKRTG